MSQSAKIENAIYVMSMLRFIFAAVTGCCWIAIFVIIVVLTHVGRSSRSAAFGTINK